MFVTPARVSQAGGLKASFASQFTGMSVSTFLNTYTHTRASHSSMVDSTGAFAWADTNLVDNTDVMSATGGPWAESNVTMTDVTGSIDPPAGMPAGTKVWEIDVTVSSGFLRRNVIPVIEGVGYSRRVYVKKKSTDGDVLIFEGGVQALNDTVTLADDWTASTTNYVASGTGNARLGIMWSDSTTAAFYVCAPQYNIGSEPCDFYRTSGSVFYAPLLNDRGLGIWEARTNLLTYSQAFDNAAWSNSGLTITADDTAAPDGTTTADLLADPGAGANYVLQDISVPDDSVERRISIYMKAGTSTAVQIVAQYFGGTGLTPNIYYNPQTRAITSDGSSGGDANVTALANGWDRIDFSSTNNGTGNTTLRMLIYPENGDDGVGSVYVWGFQVEAGSFATPYVPTGSATVTRAADVATVESIDGASWFNASEGTLSWNIEFESEGTTGPLHVVALSDGTNNNRISTLINPSGNPKIAVAVSAATVVNESTAEVIDTNGEIAKFGTAYKVNDFAAVTNGGTVVTDTAGTIPVVDTLYLDQAGGAGNGGGLYMKSLAYYPTRMPNAQLQALTA